MRRFKHLVILDNLLLPEEARAVLSDAADLIDDYSSSPVHGANAGPDAGSFGKELLQEQILDDLCELSYEYTREQTAELVRRIADADAIISCWTNLPDAILSRVPRLEYVAFWTNAIEHRISRKFCERRGIQVDYVPDYGTHAVSEYVFSALLHLYRRLPSHERDTLRGSWDYEYLKTGRSHPSWEGISDHCLHGQRLGIVGLGRIGSQVALTARLGFGMDVSYYSRTRRRELESLGLRYEPIEELVRDKDVITLHLPPDVREPVVRAHHLAAMAPGTILANTGSGRSLDEDAALSLAASGQLRLVLDVYAGKPPRQRLKLLSARPYRHFFTYRAAWYASEAISLKAAILVKQLREYLDGPRNGFGKPEH